VEATLFLTNKYRTWYDQIIERGRARGQPAGYFEGHHVIPKCKPFCGTNDPSNIVNLAFREHFLVHWLLTWFTEGDGRGKMLYALRRMTHSKTGRRIVYPWQYEIARRAHREAQTGRKRSAETRDKIGAAGRGRTFTPEHRAAISAVHLGKPLSPEHCEKISAAKRGRALTEQHRGRMKKPKSPEHCEKIRAALKANMNVKRECPNCHHHVGRANYARWHGDRCKSNPAYTCFPRRLSTTREGEHA
jgi:hypothetical protein